MIGNILVKPTKLRISPREHFFVSGIKKQFDLSVLIPMYLHVSTHLDSIERGKDMEFSIGRSTVIYAVDEEDVIHLITGWVGNRKKAVA
jgi:hypothetical protein